MYDLITRSSNDHSLQSYQRCGVGTNYSGQLMIFFKLSFLSYRPFTDNCGNITRLCHVWLGKYSNCTFITITTTMTTMTWQARRKNESLRSACQSGTVLCHSEHTRQSTNPRPDSQSLPKQPAWNQSELHAVVAPLSRPNSQMVISVIISCYHIETGAANIWETSSEDQKFLLRKSYFYHRHNWRHMWAVRRANSQRQHINSSSYRQHFNTH